MNLYGLYTLYIKEVKRFLKVYHQTIFTPMVSSLILLAVFVLSAKGGSGQIKGIAFIDFIGYGLIIMSITQQSFANSSSSLVMSKVIGYVSDLLIPPLRGFDIVIAYTFASITRGVMVGASVCLCLTPFINVSVHSYGLLIFFIIASSGLLGMLGILTGLISDSFERTGAITNYLINPLSFLSGTFYSVEYLPYTFKIINLFNPFFYMIDGFRYSLTGVADSNVTFGLYFLSLSNLCLFFLLKYLIDIGWRLKT